MFNDSEDTTVVGGKWEDEEERRFYEDVPDLKDYVPSSVLGIDNSNEVADDSDKDKEQQRIQQEKEDFRLLEEELQKLQSDQSSEISTPAGDSIAAEEDEYVWHRLNFLSLHLNIVQGSYSRSWFSQSFASTLASSYTTRTISTLDRLARSTSRRD